MPEPPKPFRVKFECSNGTFVIECVPEWAPIGAAHFEELVKAGAYDGARFFRVVPGFVVQFGIPGDPQVAAQWRTKTLRDDPVRASNAKGTICYATSGPNSRTTQVFISLQDNQRLDTMGFAPFGRVVEGMDVVEAINAEYGEQPRQDLIQLQGNTYLDAKFPRLDHVKAATLVE